MDYINGLSSKDVEKQIKAGNVNYDTTAESKSIKQILIDNICTLFNLINIILAILIIIVGSYKNLLFLGVVICNTLISTIQEVRAKKVVDKLSFISSNKAKVIRDGKKILIHINDVVLDDTILYELGDQIIADSKILKGTCEVDESFITGESNLITKKEGDILLSGSFVVSSSVYAKVIHVGIDNYTAVISRDAKKMKKEINSQIMRSLNKIVKYVSIALIPIGILLLLRQLSIPGNTFSNAIVSLVAALIGMIPEGLILLVSTVLAISVVKLSKYNVLVQDLYCIETLARVDTLCLDKTGTITEGKMEVFDVFTLDNHKVNEIDESLMIITNNLNDNNPTFNAICDKYKDKCNIKAKRVVSFSSLRKYSMVILEDMSLILGAPEIILKDKYKKYKSKIEKLSTEYRVLLLAKTTNNIVDDNLPCDVDALGLILIKDKIRLDVIETLNYFKSNDIEIKVISGDSVNTVCNVAKSVGIEINGVLDARKIDDNSDINELAENNNIFARVKPEQKRALIKALKENGHIVAMTGDGVNDVLALKESDCAISISSGADAARNVSELVLLDSNFDSIPYIVKEGRKTINNVGRSATLFLSKTIYASLLAILFLFISYKYPFMPIQMSLISTLTIGMPAFILALEPNYDRVSDKFLTNVISKAIPSGLTTILNILILVLLSSMFKISDIQISTIAVIITWYTAVLLIYRISKPLNLLRKSLLIFIVVLFMIAYLIPILRSLYSLEILKPNSILILVFLMYISTRIFSSLSKLLNIIIKKRESWFI